MTTPNPAGMPLLSPADPVSEYCIDAFQRAILLVDVLRQRGNNFFERSAREAPHVLTFDAELLIDGRTLHGPSTMDWRGSSRRPTCRLTIASAPSLSSIRVPATGQVSAA